MESCTVVSLIQGSTEYNKVENVFRSEGKTSVSIIKIEKIENKELRNQYEARKIEMILRLGRDTERTLYHGTSQDTVDKINKRGFDRSFCGKNGVALGHGTYFAKNVSLSANDTYSTRDAYGQKRIYMSKVLVGDYEVGNQNIRQPHIKPYSIHCYDSTVDNIHSPTIFVVYHAAQAYPEYIITFTT